MASNSRQDSRVTESLQQTINATVAVKTYGLQIATIANINLQTATSRLYTKHFQNKILFHFTTPLNAQLK